MKDAFKKIYHLQDEINFKELFTNPARLFGYTYFYILAVVVGIGIYFVHNLTLINKNTIPPFIVPDTTETKKDLSFSLPVDIPPVDVFKLSEPTQELLDKGKSFYLSNCSSCHGERGKGDGPAGIIMSPKPRDFTSKDGWINGRKISEIYKTLQEGILKNGMPAYNHINPEELFAVTHYIRTFAPDYPKDTRQDLQALNDTYRLSEGKKSAGQIPTSKALSIILTETSESITSYNKIIEKLTSDSEFSDLIYSKEKFAAFLINLSDISLIEAEFFNYLRLSPLTYGVSPRVNFLTDAERKNFYSYSNSFIRKKAEKL